MVIVPSSVVCDTHQVLTLSVTVTDSSGSRLVNVEAIAFKGRARGSATIPVAIIAHG